MVYDLSGGVGECRERHLVPCAQERSSSVDPSSSVSPVTASATTLTALEITSTDIAMLTESSAQNVETSSLEMYSSTDIITMSMQTMGSVVTTDPDIQPTVSMTDTPTSSTAGEKLIM